MIHTDSDILIKSTQAREEPTSLLVPAPWNEEDSGSAA